MAKHITARHRAVPAKEQLKNLEYPPHHTTIWWIETQFNVLHALASTQTTSGYLTILRAAQIMSNEARNKNHESSAVTIAWFIRVYCQDMES